MAEITKCDDETVSKLRTRLSHIYKVIDAYRWIIEAYVSDFYVKDHWSRLPPSWQQFLEVEQVDFSTLSCLLTGQPWGSVTTGCSASPLALLALKACIEHYALNRRFVELDNPCVAAGVSQMLLSCVDSRISPDSRTKQCFSPAVRGSWTDKGRLGFKNGQLMDMEHIFRKHVKPKKQHEIRQLGKVVQLVTQVSGSDHVVDVGAGLGHLSRLLTFAHGLKVTTVEAAGGHAPKASEFDRELKKDIQKKLKRIEPSDQQGTTTTATNLTPADLPSHVVCRVEPDISTEDFLALVLHRDCDQGPCAGDMVNISSNNTSSTAVALGCDDAVSMVCEKPTRSKRFSGASESGEQETPVSSFCLEPNIPTPLRGQMTSDPANQRDLSLGSSALSVCSEEIAAKISRYDGEFESGLKCDTEGVTSIQNKTRDSCVLHGHGIQSDNEQTISGSIDQSNLNKTAFESKGHSIDSLKEDRQHCLSGCGRNIASNPNKSDSEEQPYLNFDLSEHNTKTSEYENQNCETRTVEDEQKDSFSSSGIETAWTANEQKESFFHRESCPKEQKSSSGQDPEVLPAENERKEPACDKESICNKPQESNYTQSVGSSSVSGSESSGGGEGGAEGERKGLVLAGLHACGDLTATILRVFVNCPAVSALVSVGCCYMKLSAYSENDKADCERGYPMSQFVRSLPAHPLTYEAREMACHFADAYAQRLQENPPHLKIHSYRAAMQYVVTKTRPDFVTGATRLVIKRGAEMPFHQYADHCLRRLGIARSEVADDVMAAAQSMTASWPRVVSFYTLRLSLAPLVETALLLDRMLFLYEQGFTSVAVPVFDSSLSPRNFAVLACKPQSSL